MPGALDEGGLGGGWDGPVVAWGERRLVGDLERKERGLRGVVLAIDDVGGYAAVGECGGG